jgi:hypothetical protein
MLRLPAISNIVLKKMRNPAIGILDPLPKDPFRYKKLE